MEVRIRRSFIRSLESIVTASLVKIMEVDKGCLDRAWHLVEVMLKIPSWEELAMELDLAILHKWPLEDTAMKV